MGIDWNTKNISRQKRIQYEVMAHKLHKLLRTTNMFPSDSICDKYRDAIIASNGNGYLALHNIMRSTHPALVEDEVEAKIPKQQPRDTFGSYITSVVNFLDRESLRSRIYTDHEQTKLVLTNLLPKYKDDFRLKIQQHFGDNINRSRQVPFKLQLPNLSTTLTKWIKDLGLDICPVAGSSNSMVNQIDEQELEEDDTDTTDWLDLCNSIQSERYPACDMLGHTLETCHVFTNHVLASSFVKQHPEAKAKVEQIYKKFIRNRPRTNIGGGRRAPHNNEFRPRSQNNESQRRNVRFNDQGGRRLTQRGQSFVNQIMASLQEEMSESKDDNEEDETREDSADSREDDTSNREEENQSSTGDITDIRTILDDQNSDLDSDLKMIYSIEDTIATETPVTIVYKEEVINQVMDKWFLQEFEQNTYRDMSLCVQIDDGSQVTTTDHKEYLHVYTEYPKGKRPACRSASKITHENVGFGYILVPTNVRGVAVFFRSSFTPGMPTTAISPNQHLRYNHTKYSSKTITDDLKTGTATFYERPGHKNLVLDTLISGGLTYSAPIILPKTQSYVTSIPRISHLL